ncbi:phage portal protein [Mycolicibacterium vanbaalenii]|uniref:phage portal protein n=1 Tax=Mycolicibacterium vanbaalenii TaxID=110539 RepID=UPI001F449C6B|nr:phage portal protein [Mycolicibacterium vanbaalenii]UJL27008.1 phage portal protein [Mycolicibacterium vanbaalenii]WND59131.1 phage portal protein [Mycolicibacterium vanbaalenii]
MSSELLLELLAAQTAPQATFETLRRYATATQPLAFLTAEQRKVLDNRLARMAVNIPALAVSSLVERLRVSGYSDARVWELFTASDLDQLAPLAMTDALTYGTGFVLVWAKDGRPVASVESPFECAVLSSPADRTVEAGVKRFDTKTTSEAYVYLPDRVEHWRANRPRAAATNFVLVDVAEHGLETVPLVPVDNGRSEITDLVPLVDALAKVVLDMVIASHAAGFGRRWVTGIDLVERPRLDAEGNPVLDGDGEPVIDTVSPFDENATLPWAIASEPDSEFGSFAEPTLAGFETAVRVLVSQIMAVSALPSHYLGILTTQPTSADALRASEASLTARAEARQLSFGRAFEQVGRLLLAVDRGRSAAGIPLRVQWADAATRSVAQEADAVVKLYQAGLLPATFALAKLGYTADEINVIRAAKRAEVLDGQGFGLTDDNR